MKCIICDSSSDYYFSKVYTESPFDHFMRDIRKVDYHRCQGCGFVQSRTHVELDKERWNELNLRFHHYHERSHLQKDINQPPYPEQAMMIAVLGKNGILRTDNMLDYAAGYGCLSNLLAKYYDVRLKLFDPYVHDGDPTRYITQADLVTYQTVINSAMFEHVLTRRDLDQVNDLVASDGCLIIHTLVCERVPPDPEWFYLRPPVHTAFHTNKSMDILMKQWGYRSSLYVPKSKCWVMLREDVSQVEGTVANINQEFQSTWLLCKKGFVDYWKGF